MTYTIHGLITALSLFSYAISSPLTSLALDCEPDHIQLVSQAEIDNFQADHGPCDTITDGLTIDGSANPSAIIDLAGLSGLQVI